jgi:hypothetical protein
MEGFLDWALGAAARIAEVDRVIQIFETVSQSPNHKCVGDT